ncbi:unnamed protein product [Vitrella brassicaformis CCMP3155]|uniref:Uncharacterized protein n=1 Tax=Vitrella brassicaformis (strain CCMP3155) TaxID=1169540 RepID=A0A0G4H4U5_VITBC|nr:unnamed protein product [Vitrella brassicaformis CCMP3155]|eukprot:CEM38680.1 unnamed protein product [Vitrella brassicaformis CCMP3155]
MRSLLVAAGGTGGAAGGPSRDAELLLGTIVVLMVVGLLVRKHVLVHFDVSLHDELTIIREPHHITILRVGVEADEDTQLRPWTQLAPLVLALTHIGSCAECADMPDAWRVAVFAAKHQ